MPIMILPNQMKKIFIYSLIALFILTASYTVIIPNTTSAHCNLTLTDSENFNVIDCVAEGASFIIVPLLGKLVQLSGTLLDYSITWTMNLSDFVEKIPAIELAWKTIRDFATMTFIFLILYHAISMILGLEGLGKKFIINLVVAGLLINFSLFFTKVIIDASNIVTMQFYNSISTTDGATGNISGVFMQQLKMQSILDQTNAAGSGATAGSSVTTLIMGSILMLIATFTFFAAACLFLMRSAMLIFLMALSPFAYIGNVIPDTGQGAASMSKKWWPQLLSQCTFAPVFLLLVYIGMKILSSKEFLDRVHHADSLVAIIFNYAIVIMFFLFALVIAKDSGTWGAGQVIGWGKSLQKWGQGVVGRNTLGIGARYIGKKYDAAEASLKSTSIGRSVANAANIATLGIAGSINRGVRAGVKVGETSKYGSGLSLTDSDKAIKDRNQVLSSENRARARNEVLGTVVNGNPSPQQVKDIKSHVGKMTTKEIEKLKVSELTNKMLASHLTASQMEAINKSDEFTDEEKGRIRDARKEGLEEMITSTNGTGLGVNRAERAKEILKDRKPEDIAKLPKEILLRPEISIHLTANVLAKIARDGILSDTDRNSIRANFEAYRNNTAMNANAGYIAALNWLTNGQGQSIF